MRGLGGRELGRGGKGKGELGRSQRLTLEPIRL